MDTKYLTDINKNNYTLFEKNNLEIALIVLYMYENVKIKFVKGKRCNVHQTVNQSYVSNYPSQSYYSIICI